MFSAAPPSATSHMARWFVLIIFAPRSFNTATREKRREEKNGPKCEFAFRPHDHFKGLHSGCALGVRNWNWSVKNKDKMNDSVCDRDGISIILFGHDEYKFVLKAVRRTS